MSVTWRMAWPGLACPVCMHADGGAGGVGGQVQRGVPQPAQRRRGGAGGLQERGAGGRGWAGEGGVAGVCGLTPILTSMACTCQVASHMHAMQLDECMRGCPCAALRLSLHAPRRSRAGWLGWLGWLGLQRNPCKRRLGAQARVGCARAHCAHACGLCCAVVWCPRRRRRRHGLQVFDAALNASLTHPEWALHAHQLAWFVWPQEQQEQVRRVWL